MLLHQTSLDYTKHCSVPFGAYVQAHHENNPTNTNAARTIDAIYLRPNNNMQGGHELLNLSTGKVITRRTVTKILLTDLVIKAIQTMSTNDKIHSLKVTTKAGVELQNADRLAGVDYEQNDSDNNCEQNDSDNNYNEEENEEEADDDYEYEQEEDEE